MERAGKFYVSVSAGAERVLVLRNAAAVIREWQDSKYVILSRGPWPEMQVNEAVEFLFEDYTVRPFALHVMPNSFDLLPAEPELGKQWLLSAWVLQHDRPHEALERLVRWRRVARIPDLSGWNDKL